MITSPTHPSPGWLDLAAWPYPPRFVDTGDGLQHFVDVGRGAPLVLVHGTPTWSFDWRHVIASQSKQRRVIAVDHLGFGLSERPATARYTPEAHAGRFRLFMSRAHLDSRVTLAIHDFGGPIALDWALDHTEELERLIVLNTWMWPFDDDPLMKKRAKLVEGKLGRFLYRRLNASLRLLMPSAYADSSKLTKALHAQYLPVFRDADSRERVLFALARSLLESSAFYAGLWGRRERLAKVPITILWGMKDPAFQPYLLERWQSAFPHATVVPFAESGHWPHEEEPAAFERALSEALGGRGALEQRERRPGDSFARLSA